MTKQQRKNWTVKAQAYEKQIAAFYKANPNREPDGSFAMSVVAWAWSEARRDLKRSLAKGVR